MRKRAALLLAFAVAAVAAPIGAQAHDDGNACAGTVTPISAGGQTLYIDDRRPAHGQFNTVPGGGYLGDATGAPVLSTTDPFGHGADGVWLYLESNGRAGLQRGGYSEVVKVAAGEEDGEFYADQLGEVDVCQQAGTPDTILF